MEVRRLGKDVKIEPYFILNDVIVMSSYDTNNFGILPTHNSVAKFVYRLYKNEYKCNSHKKSYIWFHKQGDGTWKEINDILIRKRLSTDVVLEIDSIRSDFKNSREYTLSNESTISNNKILESWLSILSNLIIKKNTLRDANRIDDAREVEHQIRDAENSIDLITKKQELHLSDIRDKVFGNLAEIVNKLNNNTFKNGVMKDLVELFYEATY